jgi:hypothetical protein
MRINVELRTQTLVGRFHHNEPYQLSSHPITLVFGSTYLIMLFVIFFSIHKLDFNLRLCKMVVDIVIYIRKIFMNLS